MITIKDLLSVGVGIEFEQPEKYNRQLWWPHNYGENKFLTESVSFEWRLPYVTIYWESDAGEESNLHSDMVAEINFVVEEI